MVQLDKYTISQIARDVLAIFDFNLEFNGHN